MFGTMFLPGLNPINYKMMKPDKFGLPYAYPQDYFMQHWFSFHRFDVKKIEAIPLVQTYIDWKKPVLRLFKKEEEEAKVIPQSQPIK